MKKFLIILSICTLFANTAFTQSKKTMNLLETGIKTNDLLKIEDALKSGAKPDDGLTVSIELGNYNMVQYFVDKKGASPTNNLLIATYFNNDTIVKYLLEKGAEFTDWELEELNGQVFWEHNRYKTPVTFVRRKGFYDAFVKEEGNDKLKNISSGSAFIFDENDKISYNTKKELRPQSYLVNAIRNNNYKMVDLLLSHGIDLKRPCVIKNFFYITRRMPSIIMRPLEYAMLQCADKNIVDALLKYDTIANYKFSIEKVTYSGSNEYLNNVTLIPFDYGCTIKLNANIDKIYGMKLLYSTDNVNFKELNNIPGSTHYENLLKKTENSITFYYCTAFNPTNKTNELFIKIEPKEFLLDTRDGQKYRTVKIGNIEIMAENFRYKPSEGYWTYKNDESNVQKLGYLYTWENAIKNVPPGWHLPSKEEWEKLYAFLDVPFKNVVTESLPGGSSGLNILWSGIHDKRMGFTGGPNGAGPAADFWSSTPASKNWAWAFMIWSSMRNEPISQTFSGSGLSVRYIKD